MSGASDVEKLRARLQHLGVELRSKPNYTTWSHWFRAVVGRLVFTIGWLLTAGSFDRSFGEFWTQMGSTLYAPAGSPVDLYDPGDYRMVCHELAHRYDARALGWRYRIAYIVSRRSRALFEARAYAMNFVAEYRLNGSLERMYGTAESFATKVAGAAYFFANHRPQVEATLSAVVERLEGEGLDIDAFDPESPALFGALPSRTKCLPKLLR